jgi:hypothetical protein
MEFALKTDAFWSTLSVVAPLKVGDRAGLEEALADVDIPKRCLLVQWVQAGSMPPQDQEVVSVADSAAEVASGVVSVATADLAVEVA